MWSMFINRSIARRGGCCLQRLVRRFVSHFPGRSRTEGATTHQPSGNALGNAITHNDPSPERARHEPSFALSGQESVVGVHVFPGRCRWADEFLHLWRVIQTHSTKTMGDIPAAERSGSPT